MTSATSAHTATAFDDERHRDPPRGEAENQEQPATDFEVRHRRRKHFGHRHPQFGKPTDALIDVDEFEQTLPKEHSACHEPEQQRRFGCVER